MRGRVLIVDDDLETCRMLEQDLLRRTFAPASRTSADEAFEALSEEEFDVVVTDLRMRGTSGLELCERIRVNRPDVPVVVITAFGSLETAVGAIRAGAYDFVTKPFEIEELVFALDRAVEHRRLREEVKRLRRAAVEDRRYDDILGTSAAMRSVFDLLDRVAASEASVLITGETGTGKELAARALHRRGRRKEGPFLAINCAAVPEALLESQLFGHRRGAFTDAREKQTGLFVQASGGTLFLDEIGDMPLGLQPKILRAIQERVVRPLGSDDEIPFDVRIIAATNRDIDEAVEEGRFRKDLYFRINVIQVRLPPLRARGTDVLLLAQHFVDHFSVREGKRVGRLSPGAAEKLVAYAWPGNVRELQNAIERAVALTAFEEITVEDLPEKVRSYRSSHIIVAAEDPTELVPMEEVERRYILRVLQAAGGIKSQAAQILGLDRRTLYRKLERYTERDKPP
jgi:two-component system, NtrC family, response regulator AtoC